MGLVLSVLIIFICVYMSLRGLMIVDRQHGMEFSNKAVGVLFFGCLVSACIWCVTTENKDAMIRFSWLLIHIYFLCCSVTDHLTCQVYDIFQYLGIVAAGYLLLRTPENVAVGISVLLFALLQYFIFMKLYGAADGMAFLIAAGAEASLGYDINIYLLHMIAAYLLLSLRQAIRGNIGKKGKLKAAVPFLPDIMVSFWGILICGEELVRFM